MTAIVYEQHCIAALYVMRATIFLNSGIWVDRGHAGTVSAYLDAAACHAAAHSYSF